jgi:glycosyltransferase involved in cell wall biosynthesis
LNREELRDLYHAADVGLFPVGKQGGWLAPFEMLCSGNPIIVSGEMGASSIIKEKDLGTVTNDYADALLNIKKSKSDSNWIKKNLSWNRFADRMIRAYKNSI